MAETPRRWPGCSTTGCAAARLRTFIDEGAEAHPSGPPTSNVLAALGANSADWTVAEGIESTGGGTGNSPERDVADHLSAPFHREAILRGVDGYVGAAVYRGGGWIRSVYIVVARTHNGGQPLPPFRDANRGALRVNGQLIGWVQSDPLPNESAARADGSVLECPSPLAVHPKRWQDVVESKDLTVGHVISWRLTPAAKLDGLALASASVTTASGAAVRVFVNARTLAPEFGGAGVISAVNDSRLNAFEVVVTPLDVLKPGTTYTATLRFRVVGTGQAITPDRLVFTTAGGASRIATARR